MPTKAELTLEQSQQGVSNDVLNIIVILFSIHSDDGNPSSVNIKQHYGRFRRWCYNLIPANYGVLVVFTTCLYVKLQMNMIWLTDVQESEDALKFQTKELEVKDEGLEQSCTEHNDKDQGRVKSSKDEKSIRSSTSGRLLALNMMEVEHGTSSAQSNPELGPFEITTRPDRLSKSASLSGIYTLSLDGKGVGSFIYNITFTRNPSSLSLSTFSLQLLPLFFLTWSDRIVIHQELVFYSTSPTLPSPISSNHVANDFTVFLSSSLNPVIDAAIISVLEALFLTGNHLKTVHVIPRGFIPYYKEGVVMLCPKKLQPKLSSLVTATYL
ncbi:hypothetical protein Tco_1238449 [Tanacetum coccineum]